MNRCKYQLKHKKKEIPKEIMELKSMITEIKNPKEI